tara:strand:+ start:91 stop:192 length:102 start_codon:yes stop_codon:yes gene_type:complete
LLLAAAEVEVSAAAEALEDLENLQVKRSQGERL